MNQNDKNRFFSQGIAILMIAVFFLCGVTCLNAEAFECNDFDSVSQKDIALSMGVFLGEAVSVDQDASRGYMKKHRAVFKIKKMWKGNYSDTIPVYSFSSFGSKVEVGKNYLFFTSMFVETKEYTLNNCSIIEITPQMEKELDNKLGVPTPINRN